MIPALLLSAFLVTAEGTDAPSGDALVAYREAAGKVGRDPDSQIKLALWCERHGLEPERLRHLAAAVLADPANATARGLLGLVSYSGRWMRPESVAEKVKADVELAEKLAKYNAQRAKAKNTADSQWSLGLWCEEHGLKAEATAHFSAVTRLDPKRDVAWKRLGYRKHNNRWMTEAEVRAEKVEAEAQHKADLRWKRQLETWLVWLEKPSKRDELEKALSEVKDPRAVPSILSVFVHDGGIAGQLKAVQLLGQIESPSASRALAKLAATASSARVRQAATRAVVGRDPREVVSSLIARLRDPIKYEVRPVAGPGSAGMLFVEGKRFNMRMLYSPPAAPDVPFQPGDTVQLDAFGLPMIERNITGAGMTAPAGRGMPANRGARVGIPVGEMVLEAQKSAYVAQKQLEADIAAIDETNRKTKERNDRVRSVLSAVTSEDKGDSRVAWQTWWTEQNGYTYIAPKEEAKPTLTQDVPLAYMPQAIPIQVMASPSLGGVGGLGGGPGGRAGQSCFGAGTPVRTMSGSRNIETIQVGDLVLSQDATTGLLNYQPVTAVFHNRPSATLQLRLGDEPLVVTGIHRLWKSGHGWVMARELKPGDRVRTVGGSARVEAIDEGTTQPVFNLEVASGHSFFVGYRGLLAHDNTLVEPTPRPFDAEPALASVSGNAAIRP